MRTPDELRTRILAGGDTPARRTLFEAHFASGAPRKLHAAARRVELERARVLELGCGWGVHLAHFSPASVGLDADAERVAFVRSIGCRAEAVDLDVPGWSAGLVGFDVLFAADLLPHLRAPEVLFGELASPLRPGGTLVLCEWLFPRGGLARALATRVPGAREVLEHPEHLRQHAADELVRSVEAAGLRVHELYAHSFANPLLARAVGWFWPPHTLLATKPG